MRDNFIIKTILIGLFLSIFTFSNAQIMNVGSGGYTTSFPGADAAGRNSYPSGKPQLSGEKQGKPVPTNDWWSKLVKEDHASNLFSYPYTLKTINAGLVVSYIPTGVIDDLLPITVGVVGLSAEKATVSNFTDWTVSMNWNDGTHNFETTAGIGMPFLYFTKGATDIVQITVTSGSVNIDEEMLIIEKAKNGATFVAYAPKGSSWVKNSNTYTSTLNGKNYWSMAFLPLTATNVKIVAEEYKKYAYVFPKNTTVDWNYNNSTSIVRTDFKIEPDIKEGSNSNLLIGLLPHHWAHLASNSAQPNKYSYQTIRGEMKTMEGNTFSVENRFYGILPTLPYIDMQSSGFEADKLTEKVEAIKNDEIGSWTDSYNDGQLMNRLVQTARIADETGNIEARNTMLNTIKNRLENWLKAESGEIAFIFYYNKDWSALIGYPAGHGQDNNLNDHHFHWGYFIHAAAFLEQYQPGWAAQWGEMINLLVRDAASTDRNDSMFPFLRNFSPYAGHSWANGFATFPQGNDQESTSESMQFNSSLIHWGTITGNEAVRNLGIYLYTTEQTAIEEYWLDVHDRIFPSTQQYSLVSRVWGNNFDNGTFWTNDIAASYGIELYPIHGGSLYLGHHKEYVKKLWDEIKKNTGITRNEVNPNLWHDVMWQYASFINPSEAINMYNSNPNRELKFGISDAQTYHWLHAMNVLGDVDTRITADYPIAVAFNQNGRMTYVAHNYSNSPLLVTFSDGYQLNVPARKMYFDNAGSTLPVVSLTSPENNTKHTLGEFITISANAIDYNGIDIRKVEFYSNGDLIDTDTSAPYSISWKPSKGIYALTARATNVNGQVGESQIINITVSDDSPCSIFSTEAEQGSFTEGYIASFETIGTTVNVTFELLDTNRNGVVAYLWNKVPFSETSMSNVEGNVFAVSLSGQQKGTKIELACKFAYEGGMSVTKYLTYEVGVNCSSSLDNESLVFVELYPNPIDDVLNIKSSKAFLDVYIYNIQGRNLFNKTISNNESIDMSGYLSGVYLVKIVRENETIIRKVIKK